MAPKSRWNSAKCISTAFMAAQHKVLSLECLQAALGSVHGRGVIFGGISDVKTSQFAGGVGVVTAAGGLGWSCSTSH